MYLEINYPKAFPLCSCVNNLIHHNYANKDLEYSQKYVTLLHPVVDKSPFHDEFVWPRWTTWRHVICILGTTKIAMHKGGDPR